jgi:hypothetical protein
VDRLVDVRGSLAGQIVSQSKGINSQTQPHDGFSLLRRRGLWEVAVIFREYVGKGRRMGKSAAVNVGEGRWCRELSSRACHHH